MKTQIRIPEWIANILWHEYNICTVTAIFINLLNQISVILDAATADRPCRRLVCWSGIVEWSGAERGSAES